MPEEIREGKTFELGLGIVEGQQHMGDMMSMEEINAQIAVLRSFRCFIESFTVLTNK